MGEFGLLEGGVRLVEGFGEFLGGLGLIVGFFAGVFDEEVVFFNLESLAFAWGVGNLRFRNKFLSIDFFFFYWGMRSSILLAVCRRSLRLSLRSGWGRNFIVLFLEHVPKVGLLHKRFLIVRKLFKKCANFLNCRYCDSKVTIKEELFKPL